MDKLPVDLPASVSLGIPSVDTLEPSVVKALAVFLVVFVAAIFIGFGRRYLISSSLQGIWAGFLMGIMTIAALEGAIFWGARDFVFGEKQAMLPNNIRIVLDDSRENITQVLGIETEKEVPTAQSVVSDYDLLSPLDVELARNSICKPVTDGIGEIVP
ncbi:hypothetical protein CMO96_03655 [Candidatus Woesebacteria bacterium]|nr:hypothetical protein [Candidatus Woesebacteria bacterium]